MAVEKPYDGYWGIFRQNLSHFTADSGLTLNRIALAKALLTGIGERESPEKADVIKFMAVDVPPYIFSHDILPDQEFKVGGPFFSVIVDAAKFGNFSITGVSPNPTLTNEIYAIFQPDTLLCPLRPFSRLFLSFFQGFEQLHMLGIETLGHLTESIGNEDLSHIVYTRNYKTHPTVSFLSLFNIQLWIPALVFVLIDAALGSCQATPTSCPSRRRCSRRNEYLIKPRPKELIYDPLKKEL